MKEQYGCQAHYCYLTGPRSGMCTNSGCACLKSLPTGIRLAIERRILGLEANVNKLEAQAEKNQREYQKYEFCKAVDCASLLCDQNGVYHCIRSNKMCQHTAKEIHHWLKENGFKIVKETNHEKQAQSTCC